MTLVLLEFGATGLAESATPLAQEPPPCTDADKDGFAREGGDCGPVDCNDANPNINPRAAEICGDGADNNCDGDVDFGVVPEPDGPNCTIGNGPQNQCLTNGIRVCSPDNRGFVCEPVGPLNLFSPEGRDNAGSCFDFRDNDCDGLVDHQDQTCQGQEVCNGFDDDFDGTIDDGFNIGKSCSVGVGTCGRTGVLICSANGSGAVCSASPGVPATEGPAGSLRCTDGLDNDCDGLADLFDSSCQAAETCDGRDNDGDFLIDEDFKDLGQECSTGVGSCNASGVRVCSPNGRGTVCGATPRLASSEGPSGRTCSDESDNDCDGFADLGDPDCNSALLSVQCALPLYRPQFESCHGFHRVIFETSGHGPDAIVTAELMGLDPEGKVIDRKKVKNGDLAELKARIHPVIDDRGKQRLGFVHKVTAPVPMLRVSVEENGQTREAFCSPAPYLEVIRPANTVVTESEGDIVEVSTAIPRTDPGSLFVKVDGVEILSQMGIDPASDFPGGPYSGTIVVNGRQVEVTDLVVDTAPFEVLSSNTLFMRMSGLGCGGHVIVVDGEAVPGAFSTFPPTHCYVDDVRDKGISMNFGIEIESPTPGLITAFVPTPVVGRACHGRPIQSVEIQGKALNISGQTFTPGDGEDTADTYEIPFNIALPQTNLAADIAGTTTALGTFDRGSNRLVAGGTDDLANRTFESLLFAVASPGELVSPGIFSISGTDRLPTGPSVETGSRVRDWIQGIREKRAQKGEKRNGRRGRGLGSSAGMMAARVSAASSAADILPLNATTDIPDAFVLGMDVNAINTFFQSTCEAASALAEQRVRDALVSANLPRKSVSGGISCNPTVTFRVTDVDFDGSLGCSIALAPADNKLTLRVNLPAIRVTSTARGACKTTFLGVCISETIVDMAAVGTISGSRVDFDITETQFISGGESEGRLTPGVASVEITRDRNEINCLAGFLADLLDFVLDAFFLVFTFGQVDNPLDLTPNFEGVFKEFDLNEKFGIIEFPLRIKEVKINKDEVAATNKILTTELQTIDVKANGLQVIFKASFAATSVDPEVEPTAGALLTPAPPPVPGAPGSGNTFFVVADDAFNQLFASMTTQGEFKTFCIPSGKEIQSLAPPNCDALGNVILRGSCKALKGVDCAGLPVGERLACNPIRNRLDEANIQPDMSFLYCGRLDNPPRLLIQDQGGTPGIDTHLRLNDLLVGVVVDRNGDDLLDGELPSTAQCFKPGSNTVGDCKLVAACLDLNVTTDLVLQTTGGSLKLVPNVQGVGLLDRPEGAVCEGGINFGDFEFLRDAAASDPLGDLQDNIDELTPPLQSEGLDLGGIVMFSNPRLIAIETDGNLEFQDYVGITGDITPN